MRKLLLAMATALSAAAPLTAPAQSAAPTVRWELQVVEDGRTVDRFGADTPIGQLATDTHQRSVTHDVGCRNVPAATIELQRTLSVSPLRLSDNGIELSINAHETLEDPTPRSTREGCTLPPQPRVVTADHPDLLVPPHRWVDWTVIDSKPTLVYRVRAAVVGTASAPGDAH